MFFKKGKDKAIETTTCSTDASNSPARDLPITLGSDTPSDDELPGYHADDDPAAPASAPPPWQPPPSYAGASSSSSRAEGPEEGTAWSGPPVGIDSRYLRSDPCTLTFRPVKVPLSNRQWTAIDKATSKPLFHMRSTTLKETMTQAKNSFGRGRGKAAGTDDAALRGATYVVEDTKGTALLYLRPSMRMFDVTGLQSELQQYDAHQPGTSKKAFSVAYPAEDHPMMYRTPELYLSFTNTLDPREKPQRPVDKQQAELYHDDHSGGNPAEPEKTMVRLINGDKREERWSMNILPSKHWIAQCWPTGSLGLFRNPISSAEVLTLLVAPQVDLLLVAAVAFGKLNTDMHLRQLYQSQMVFGAPVGNLALAGM